MRRRLRLSKQAYYPFLLKFILPWAVCGLLFSRAHAQPEFDRHLDWNQIQKLLESSGSDYRKQALAWYHWAYYDEQVTGISDSAFQYLARSADRFLKANDSSGYERVRADIADRLLARKKFDTAINMYNEALDFYKRSNNQSLEAHMLARLHMAYDAHGDSVLALQYRRAFSDLNETLHDTTLEILVLKAEIEKLRKRHDYRGATSIGFRALQLAQASNRAEFVNWAQFSIGDNSRLDRNYPKALDYLHQAEQSKPQEETRRAIYLSLSEAYAAIDSFQKAQYYAVRYSQLGDSLFNKQSEASLTQLANRYHFQAQVDTILRLTQENEQTQTTARTQQTILIALFAIFLAFVLVFIFYLRDYRYRIRTAKVIASQTSELNQQHIRELEDKLKIETMQSMLIGQESERRRIAQDLHDSVGGLLAAIKMQVEKIQGKNGEVPKNADLTKIKTLLDNTVAETRHIARNMQPNTLLEFGLPTALRDLTNHFRSDGIPSISFQTLGDFSNLDHNLALNCYRIVQELLQNSLKHAKSKEILVQITRTDQQIDLLVEDDGVGYEPGTVKKGMGTDSVAQRVQFLKGELNIQTAKGQGTSTYISIPVN